MRKALGIACIIVLVAVSFLAGRWHQKTHLDGTSSAQAGRKVLYYVDPMNPGFRSDKPGVAPCGMPLEAVYAGGSTDPSRMPPGTVNVTTEQQQLIGVKVATVEKSSWSHTIRVVGRVVPDETRIYRINSASDGWVKTVLPVTVGSLVRKDEMIATFYSPEFFPAIKAYLYALRQLDRFEASGTETQGQIDLTNANIDSYRISLLNLGMSEHQIEEMKSTRQGVDNIEIRAPGAGFITARNISIGQRFERGAELYRIADLSRVWVLADVFENESEYFQPGITARVILPDKRREFLAKVSMSLPQFDPASRTMKVRLEVDNPGFFLRPDMFVDVDLPVALPSTISVPVDAVRYSGLKTTVFIDRGHGFFEPREVETGWRFGNRVEIVRGLMPGERIVVSGNFLIDSESRMRSAAEGIRGVAQKDPVCGMDVDEVDARAAGRVSDYDGRKYFFCSDACKRQFDKDPGHVLKKSPAMGRPGTITAMKTSPALDAGVQQDPVCGMKVERDQAEAAGRTSAYRGKNYYFCSDACKEKFAKDPGRYASKQEETHLVNHAAGGGSND
ncbi:MAG TPA: efflux RND transporter periplasmic adaptor subunit [Nitrospirota bacterium]|nr:efflux RND transporter periplasmic adaptor subunit [Nitrospirota bacterium]